MLIFADFLHSKEFSAKKISLGDPLLISSHLAKLDCQLAKFKLRYGDTVQI